MDGVQLSQDYRATTRITFNVKSVPKSPWYSFNQLQKDKRLR